MLWRTANPAAVFRIWSSIQFPSFCASRFITINLEKMAVSTLDGDWVFIVWYHFSLHRARRLPPPRLRLPPSQRRRRSTMWRSIPCDSSRSSSCAWTFAWENLETDWRVRPKCWNNSPARLPFSPKVREDFFVVQWRTRLWVSYWTIGHVIFSLLPSCSHHVVSGFIMECYLDLSCLEEFFCALGCS